MDVFDLQMGWKIGRLEDWKVGGLRIRSLLQENREKWKIESNKQSAEIPKQKHPRQKHSLLQQEQSARSRAQLAPTGKKGVNREHSSLLREKKRMNREHSSLLREKKRMNREHSSLLREEKKG